MRTYAHLLLLAAAACATQSSELDEELRSELLAMAERDQALRKLPREELAKLPPGPARVDVENAKRLAAIVEEAGWPTRSLVGDDGAQAAFLIVQHANHDPELQARCLPMLERAATRGEISKKHVAYLTDRIRVRNGEPQLYGTQYSAEKDEHGNVLAGPDGKLRYLPPLVEDVEKLDERRHGVGLGPWAEYDRRMAEIQECEPFAKPRAAR